MGPLKARAKRSWGKYWGQFSRRDASMLGFLFGYLAGIGFILSLIHWAILNLEGVKVTPIFIITVLISLAALLSGSIGIIMLQIWIRGREKT